MALKDLLSFDHLELTGSPPIPRWIWEPSPEVFGFTVEIIELEESFHGKVLFWEDDEGGNWSPSIKAAQSEMNFDKVICWLEEKVLELFPESRGTLFPPSPRRALQRILEDDWP